MCDISASESSFWAEAVCAGSGDAFVRNDKGDDQTNNAQLRPTQAKTAFVPVVHFDEFIVLPSSFN
jgi:hypothetical protein